MVNLANLTSDEQKLVWCQLNCWEWPDRLIDDKPANWKNLSMDERLRFASPLMRSIEHNIAFNSILDYWNHVFRPSGGDLKK